MGRMNGKVVFITGAARGQGRSHAIRLAEEGADIIAVDICEPIESARYELGSDADMAATVKEVESLGRRIFAQRADVRDRAGLQRALDAGIAELGGGVDVVLANAGILPLSLHPAERAWQDTLDVNLTGVLHTVEAAIPGMITRACGGSIVLTSSTAGAVGVCGPSEGGLAYTAAKHGVVGLMRQYANNLAPYGIRVNSVHPTGVDTLMTTNPEVQAALTQDPSLSNAMANALPVPLIEPIDVSNAVLWLASDEARYVTGSMVYVDAGYTNKK
jgi:SDR family mycofactocin-dependent oxidoreductase